MYFWIITNNATGQIGTGSGTHAPDETLAGAGFTLIGPYDDQSNQMPADFETAYNSPSKYLYQNSQFVEQPYFSLSAVNGTVTATLNNPPSTPPTETTFTVCGQTFTEALTNNQATFTFSLHPSVATQTINVSVSAIGCVGKSIDIGGTDSSIPLQVVTPSSGMPTVGPSGSGAIPYLQSYFAVNATTIEAMITNIGTGLSVLYDVVFNVLLPAAKKATYTPVTLDANQTSAVSALETGLASSLFTTLENGFPNGGAEQMQFGAFIQNFQRGAANVQGFMEALQTFSL